MPFTPIGATRYPLGEHVLPEDFFLDDLTDVYAPEPDEHDIIYWDSTTGYWRTGSVLDTMESFDMEGAGGAPWFVPGQEAATCGTLAEPSDMNLPTNCKTGNLLLAFVSTNSWMDWPGVDGVTGFTYMGSIAHVGQACLVYYRVVTGTEGATTPISWSFEIADHQCHVFEVQDAKDPATYPFDVKEDGVQIRTPPDEFQVSEITPTYGNCWLYLAVYHSPLSITAGMASWDTSYTHKVYSYFPADGDSVGSFHLIAKRSVVDSMQAGGMVSDTSPATFMLGSVAIPGTLAGSVDDNAIFAWDAYSQTWMPQMWYDLELSHEDHIHVGDEGTVLVDLDDLGDVEINTPADHEVLAYDVATSHWINMTAAEAGLSETTHDHDASYSAIDHDHDVTYAPIAHVGAGGAAHADVVAAGDDGFMTGADKTKLDGIEAGATVAGASHALDDMTDVNAAAPGDDQVLTWDSGTSKWVAADVPAGGAHALDDHSDVDAAAPTDQDVLTWDNDLSTWVAQAPPAAGPHAIDDHTDVSAAAPNAGDVFTWDDVNGYWEPAAPAGGADHLDDLTDVDAAAPTDGQVLTWDDTASAWHAHDPAGGTIVTTRTLIYSVPGALAASTGAAKAMLPYAITIVSCRALVGTAPTGASAIIDVHKDGTTIYSTQGNRPTIAAGNTDSGSWVAPDVTAFAANSYFTVDIDQVGSTNPGANLTLMIQYTMEES